MTHPSSLDWPTLAASTESLRYMVEHKCARVLTWPVEPDSTRQVPEMFVDMQTANALVTVRDALNDQNKEHFDKAVAESTVKFLRLVDFAWSQVILKKG